MRYEATQVRGTLYAIRPVGTLGTCGWIKGEAWAAVYLRAKSPAAAMLKFHVSHNGKPVEKTT